MALSKPGTGTLLPVRNHLGFFILYLPADSSPCFASLVFWIWLPCISFGIAFFFPLSLPEASNASFRGVSVKIKVFVLLLCWLKCRKLSHKITGTEQTETWEKAVYQDRTRPQNQSETPLKDLAWAQQSLAKTECQAGTLKSWDSNRHGRSCWWAERSHGCDRLLIEMSRLTGFIVPSIQPPVWGGMREPVCDFTHILDFYVLAQDTVWVLKIPEYTHISK